MELMCKCVKCGKIDELRLCPQLSISPNNGKLKAVLRWECACGNKAELDGNFMGLGVN